MYSSTGISLQELLQAQGMLEPDNEDDYVLISSETYGMHVEGLDQPATEVIPELADSEWIRKERLVGKVSCLMVGPSLVSLTDSGYSRPIVPWLHTCLRETFEYLGSRNLVRMEEHDTNASELNHALFTAHSNSGCH